MRKLILLIFIISMCAGTSFANNTRKEYDGKEAIPESSYRIEKSRTDSLFSIMIVPLWMGVQTKSLIPVGGGGDLEITPFERFGIHLHGKKSYSYWFHDVHSEKIDNITGSSLEIGGGVTMALYVNRSMREVPITLGTRYTGHNQTTTYYSMCDVPAKTTVSARAGYIRNTLDREITYMDDYITTGTVRDRLASNLLYAGLEWSMTFDTMITITDKNIQNSFGTSFSEEGKFKWFADLLYSMSESGNRDPESKLGFRLGYVYWGKPWGARFEGGRSPVYGNYFGIEMGLCYVRFSE